MASIQERWGAFCLDEFNDFNFDYKLFDLFGAPWFLNSRGERKAWFYPTPSAIYTLVKKDLPGFFDALKQTEFSFRTEDGYIYIDLRDAFAVRRTLFSAELPEKSRGPHRYFEESSSFLDNLAKTKTGEVAIPTSSGVMTPKLDFNVDRMISEGSLQRDFERYATYRRWEEFCKDPHDEEVWQKVLHASARRKTKGIFGMVNVFDFSKLPKGPYVDSKGVPRAWFRLEADLRVSIDAQLPGFLKALKAKQYPPMPFELTDDGRIVMDAHDAYEVKHGMDFEASFKSDGHYVIRAVKGLEWAGVRYAHNFRVTREGRLELEDPSTHPATQSSMELAVAALVGMPVAALRFRDLFRDLCASSLSNYAEHGAEYGPEYGCGWIMVPGERAILVKAYSQIYDLYPYDADLQTRCVKAVDETYDYAIASLVSHTSLKVDYRFLVLKECRSFSRVSTSSDLPDPLPRYWYDPTEVSGGLEELMDLLAIEEAWSPGVERYQLKAWFPAGAMFLVATAEKQLTTKGGGTEYVLVSPGEGRVTLDSTSRYASTKLA